MPPHQLFLELEAAAKDVIRFLKRMPEFSNARILVIGGLGVWKYLTTYRTTEVSIHESLFPAIFLLILIASGCRLSYHRTGGSRRGQNKAACPSFQSLSTAS